MRVPRRHEMQVALVLRRVRRVALARRRRQGDSESDAIHLVDSCYGFALRWRG